MQRALHRPARIVAVAAGHMPAAAAAQAGNDRDPGLGQRIELGPRPYFLVDGMDDGPLKDQLKGCYGKPVKRTSFSIAHRGAPLQFPEHTKESYLAAARMGVGVAECDVTFTNDGTLVCRHAYDDLHTTTDIVATPLATSCRTPFTPAVRDGSGAVVTPARASCRTSDISYADFKSLSGKMDASNGAAATPQEYLGGTPDWRTDLYAGRGTLMSFRESIELFRTLGLKHTPELKEGDPASIKAVFGSQEAYAQALVNELQAAGVQPADAYPQSFNVNDVLYWLRHTAYGSQAVFLVDFGAKGLVLRGTNGQPITGDQQQLDFFRWLRTQGVRIVAPSIPALLAVEGSKVVPSPFARALKQMGFQIITWSFERADLRKGAAGVGGYYAFDPKGQAIRKDSDMYKALDVLAKDLQVIGVFSDWPATVSYYASCMDLK